MVHTEFAAGCYVSDAHADEIEGLVNLGVTHVLVLGDAPAPQVPSGAVGFRVHRVPLAGLSDHFERAAAFLRRLGRVFFRIGNSAKMRWQRCWVPEASQDR